jgi:hypothetical protein
VTSYIRVLYITWVKNLVIGTSGCRISHNIHNIPGVINPWAPVYIYFVVPYIGGFSESNLLQVTLLVNRIFRWILDFWKIFVPLQYTVQTFISHSLQYSNVKLNSFYTSNNKIMIHFLKLEIHQQGRRIWHLSVFLMLLETSPFILSTCESKGWIVEYFCDRLVHGLLIWECESLAVGLWRCYLFLVLTLCMAEFVQIFASCFVFHSEAF